MDLKRAHVLFDPVAGSLLVTAAVFCTASYPATCNYPVDPGCSGCVPPLRTFRITGLTPLFEILQTYTPTADAVQFRVAAHPEGLRSADHFDTYWGHVSDLPDFTQAQPMQ